MIRVWSVLALSAVLVMAGPVSRPAQAEGLLDPMPSWALAAAFGTQRLFLKSLLADRPRGAEQAAQDTAAALGLGPDVRLGQPRLSFGLRPVVVHDPNINAGLPFDRIEIGALSFTVTEETRAKAAWTYGARVSAGLDMPLAAGLVAQVHAHVGRRHAPRHDTNITERGAGLCLRHTADIWVFLDGCLSVADLENARSRVDSQSRVVTLGRLYDTARGVHELALSAMQITVDGQDQNRIRLSQRSMIAGIGALDLGLTLGERIEGRLVPVVSADLGYGALVLGRPTRLSVSYVRDEGGRLFGQDRADTSWTLRASRTVARNVMVTVSHKRTTSSISAFNDRAWGIGLEYTGLRW